jgi:hypothetical protein
MSYWSNYKPWEARLPHGVRGGSPAPGLTFRFDSYVLASNYLGMKYIDLINRHVNEYIIYKN